MAHMRIKLLVCLLAVLMSPGARAMAVFACEPEWASLVRALWPQARVHVATTHLQDPHHIEARPSLIAQLRGADLAVCTGAALESGWLPMLQSRAGNASIQEGQPGMFYAADHVALIDPFKGVKTPFAGDVHLEGNPHLHADPHRLIKVSQALAARMAALQPDGAHEIAARQRQFEAALRAKISQWEQQAAALRGRRVVAQHASFGYLWQWLGIQQVFDLEPKPGMPPTPGHLDKVLTGLKSNKVTAIVVAQHQDARAGKWLSSQPGQTAPLLILPATVTDDRPDALIRWLDELVAALVQAAR